VIDGRQNIHITFSHIKVLTLIKLVNDLNPFLLIFLSHIEFKAKVPDDPIPAKPHIQGDSLDHLDRVEEFQWQADK
jgi:hypothetical protein